jgi:ABC-2 type transport system ATP-binding protein
MDAISITGLTKTFKSSWPWQKGVTVLSDVSLTVREGEIFGFLGPNGAGKTTTMKVLLGLTRADYGLVSLFGNPAGKMETHRRIGYLPESPYFYDYLTAEEFLSFYGKLSGLRRHELTHAISNLLEQVGLVEARHRQLRTFSKGMLQRIGLAQALLHDPDLVILDEPMSGLDPVGRKEVRDLILSLRDRGKTVFFSTHIISDVEMVCDRVGILVRGRMRALGRIEELVDQQAARSIEIVCDGVTGDDVPAIKRAASRIIQRGRRCLMVFQGLERVDEITAVLRDHGGTLVSITSHKPSLEEIFLERVNG